MSSFSLAYNATQKRYSSVIYNVGNDDICVTQVILIPLDIFCLSSQFNEHLVSMIKSMLLKDLVGSTARKLERKKRYQ